MKVGLTLWLCLIIWSTSFAQNAKELKLYRLLEQNRYDQLQKKAKKLLAKDRKNIHANYVMTMFYVQKNQTEQNAVNQKRNFARAIRYWKNIYFELDDPFVQLSDSLHTIFLQNASDSTLETNINNQYRNWLLVYFDEQVPPFHLDPTPTHIFTVKLDSTRIGDSLRWVMLKKAEKLEGVKYKWAGTNPKSGFDCSGFTQYVYKQVGINLPHNAQKQSDLTRVRTDLSHLKPGDLIFFGSWNGTKQMTRHAGIIFDKNGDDITVIHCVNGGVKIEGKDSSWDHYWIDKFLFGISMDQLATLHAH